MTIQSNLFDLAATEQAKQYITGLILNGSYKAASAELDAVRDYEKLIKKNLLSDIELRDFRQAILEAELSK